MLIVVTLHVTFDISVHRLLAVVVELVLHTISHALNHLLRIVAMLLLLVIPLLYVNFEVVQHGSGVVL